MINVAAHHACNRDHLAQTGHAAQVPFGTGESALRILPDVPNYRETVGLQFYLAPKHRVVQPEPVIHRWQSDRNLALFLVQSQRLRGPACQREVGIAVDPFQLDH